MAASTTVPTVVKGKVVGSTPAGIIFAPSNTTYELELAGSFGGKVDTLVGVQIRAQGRKLLTVPAGGNFVTPIKGPPKVAQGRVLAIEGNTLVVKAGVVMSITLPTEEHALDLNNGDIKVGGMVNITLMPGAKIEVAA